MDKKGICFRPTTAQQRRLLFETWEKTGSVEEACQKAHVCQRTFYKWRPRFETGGYPALEQTGSHAPHHPHRAAVEIEQRVIEMRRQNPTWGKQRIAHEMAKENHWQPVVSPNTVRRILQSADLWPKPEARTAKRKSKRWLAPPTSQGKL